MTTYLYASYRRKILIVVLIFMVLISWIEPSGVIAQPTAGIIRVAPTGTDTSGCGSESTPCRTIQYAVNAAASGDTIKIAQGTYTGSGGAVVSIKKSLTLIGGYTTSNWDTPSTDPALTIIDGEHVRRGVEISDVVGNVSIAFQGLTIRNGFNDKTLAGGEFIGGGMLCRSGDAGKTVTLSLTSVKFENNQVQGTTNGPAGGGGAGFYEKCPVTMQQVTFSGNQVIAGDATNNTRGGQALGGGFFATNGSHITANTIVLVNNTARAGSGGQGYLNDTWNRADALGGGAAMQYNNVNIVGITATNNQAVAGSGSAYGGFACGGALFFEHNTGTVAISDGVLSGNQVTGGASTSEGGASSGGAIMSTDSVLSLERLTIVNNSSIGGAGSDGGDAGGGALYFTRAVSPWGAPSTVTGVNLIIADNVAEAGAGANRWGGGGGIFSQNTDLTLYHATFSGNRVLDSMQAPALIALNYAGTDIGWSTARLYYSIIANHTPASFSYAAMALSSGDTLQMNYTLFYNNGGRNYGGSGSISNNNEVPSGNPAFVSPGAPNYNYHITYSSAARDRAIGSSTTLDIDKDARPIGAASDVGADEYVLHNAHLVVSAFNTPTNIVAGGSTSHTVVHRIVVQNTGDIAATTATLTEQLSTPSAPLSMNVSSGPTCTSGTCNYNATTRRITWSGSVPSGGSVTITYDLLVNVPTDYTASTAIPSTLNYSFADNEGGSGNGTLVSSVFINARQVYLPLVARLNE